MYTISKHRVRATFNRAGLLAFSLFLALPGLASATGAPEAKPTPATVKVDLSEWKVRLSPAVIPPGPVEFQVSNAGTIPHAFEVEGRGIERETSQIKPGGTATLRLDLRAGRYEAYCPVGKNSHKMLGMLNHLTVGDAKPAAATVQKPVKDEKSESYEKSESDKKSESYGKSSSQGKSEMMRESASEESEAAMGHEMAMGPASHDEDEYGSTAKMMKVSGGGPVIQIMPGPFPFADSAAAVIKDRPADQQADLNHKAQMGPYSNNVASISGDISLVAIDRGATGDSVSGGARFTANDGARWKGVMDRVQTKDIPFNPRFGGLVMGLFYHGASGVHTPLVPTIQSSLALWAFAHLYKNEQLVTDNAMVHVMLLSRTRKTSDWALDCWDCSDRPIEELQLQVTPAPNPPAFDSPGGFLFVNWEKSSGQRSAAY